MSEAIATPATAIPVRFEVGEKEIQLTEVNRAVRRILTKHAESFRKKFAAYKDLRDSEGRGVTIVIKSPKTLSLQISVALEFPEELRVQVEGSDKAERIV
jgi:hypothetical protein